MATRSKLIILCGIPGSGKSTYARELCKVRISLSRKCVHLSSDAIREELYGDESIQGNPSEVFSLMQKRAVEELNNGNDVIYDATNLTRKDRKCIIDVCPKFVEIVCVVCWAPLNDCIDRDSKRERSVGRDIIMKMISRFQFPFYDEGIQSIVIRRPDNYNADDYRFFEVENMKIPHDNPNHTLSIFEHCEEAYRVACEKHFSNCVREAARFHDIGKPLVKAFIDAKGNPSDHAHYYSHQCVSAWIACGFLYDEFVLWLISVHMDPFLNTKYYNALPKMYKDAIDQLHECDLLAH